MNKTVKGFRDGEPVPYAANYLCTLEIVHEKPRYDHPGLREEFREIRHFYEIGYTEIAQADTPGIEKLS